MFSFLTIFWLFREIKYIFFWIYLWQIKEYHVGRFLDHFRTYAGKKLFSGWIIAIKLILFIYFSPFIFFLIYFAESALFLKQIILGTYKKPVFTGKTFFLLAVSFLILTFFAATFDLKWLLILDILTPVIISGVVLVFQPIFVLARNKILKKAKEKIERFKDLKVIGITGSFGKTSTKEFLTTILSEKFKVLSTKDHKNSEMGIAQTILEDLKPEHQIFVAEMGAYKKGGIKLLCDIVKPKIGIVAGVNEQHLALFGSLENLLSAEGGEELAQSLPEEGLLVLNGDNKYCLDLYKKTDFKNKKIYTEKKGVLNADIWTEDIEAKTDSISFVAVNKSREMAHFKVSVLGRQNAQNLLAAILVAKELGMSFEEISFACKKIKQWQGGMVLKQGKMGIHIIDSSYSANPDGVFADLEYLKIFPQKKAIIMPCLIELGPNSGEIHKKIGAKIAEICDLAIITSKDKFKEIKGENKKIIFCQNPEEIFSAITSFCKAGDAVLLEGRVPKKLHEIL